MAFPEFFETRMGQRFFQGQVPGLISHLKTIGLNLVELNIVLKKYLNWDADIHTIAESLADIADALSTLVDIDPSRQRIQSIKVQVNELLDAIKEVGKESNHEGDKETKEDVPGD